MEAARTKKLIEDLLKQGAMPDELYLHYVDINGKKGEMKPSTYGRQGLLEALDFIQTAMREDKHPEFTIKIS